MRSEKGRNYIRIPVDFLDIIRPLADSEVGRLFTAMIEYGIDGTIPILKGNERYVWSIAKKIIDDDIELFEGRKIYGQRGKLHWNWKGGITPENQRERSGKKYEKWRNSVFARDNYTCQHCNAVGGSLNAHHIKSWAKHKDQRFNVNNGITLCEKCHKKIHRGSN